MRPIFFVFLILLSFVARSQDDRVPSQKQIQAQMKQAKNDAQQQITGLENEIAKAKANNEDPETIKQMENSLAIMKKMLGVIDKASEVNQQKRPPTISTTNTVRAYKSPYIRFFNQPVITPTEAQANDRLLWYKGKKINKNTLITTQGRVIQYDRQNNRVLVQLNEKKDSSILKLVANLKQSRQWTNNYVNREAARKNSFFDYPLVMMTMREFDLIEKEFDKIADNTIDLPGTGANLMTAAVFSSLRETYSSGPNVTYETVAVDSLDPDEWERQAHQELLNLMNNPPPLDFPPPPEHKYDLCYYCDTSIQAQYYRDKDAWGTKFTEYEAKLISMSLSIERQYQLLGVEISQSKIPNLEADINKAMALGFQRMDQKVKLLRQRYEHDVFRQEVVVSELLSAERQRQLLGYSDENSVMPELSFLNEFGGYLRGRIAANDYNVIFNYSTILGHERQEQLLGLTPLVQGQDLMQEVWNLNRFALTVDMDFDLEYYDQENKPVLKPNGSLSTANKIYVRLGRNKDCKWQLYLFNSDYGASMTRSQEMLFKIPLKVNSGIKQVKKNGGWVTYPYTGPTDLEMDFPSVRISFCPNSGPDSAILDIIRYHQETVTGDAGNSYTADFLGYLDKAIVSVTDTKNNISQMMDIIGEATTINSQATVDHPTGYGKLDKMQVDFKINGIQHDIQKRTKETTRINNTVVLFDAQNGSQFLINGQVNTAHEEFGIKVKSCIIKLKVVQEPL